MQRRPLCGKAMIRQAWWLSGIDIRSFVTSVFAVIALGAGAWAQEGPLKAPETLQQAEDQRRTELERQRVATEANAWIEAANSGGTVPWDAVATAIMDDQQHGALRVRLMAALCAHGPAVVSEATISRLLDSAEQAGNQPVHEAAGSLLGTALECAESEPGLTRVSPVLRRRLLQWVAMAPGTSVEYVPRLAKYIERESDHRQWQADLAMSMLLGREVRNAWEMWRLGTLLDDVGVRAVGEALLSDLQPGDGYRIKSQVESLAASGLPQAAEYLTTAVARLKEWTAKTDYEVKLLPRTLEFTHDALEMTVHLRQDQASELLAWATGQGSIDAKRRTWVIMTAMKRGARKEDVRAALFTYRERVRLDVDRDVRNLGLRGEEVILGAIRREMQERLGSIQEAAEQVGILQPGELVEITARHKD